MEEIMVNICFDAVEFQLKEEHDFSWLASLGNVFYVFAQNDSGNISFGINDGKEKYFVKVAGLKTIESVRTPEESFTFLKEAMTIYEDIKHPNLIELVKHYSLGDIYIALFKWADGDCLFDHWNFEQYWKNPQIVPPAKRFKQLPIEARLKSVDVLFSFLSTVSKNNYVAVDFYDGSIMYDFVTGTTTICDIDCFRRKPAFNDMGMGYWGTKRLKAPEEYTYGAGIDEATNVFTLGALLFDFFGNYTDTDIRLRYEKSAFSPCSLEKWELNQSCYDVALKSVAVNRKERYFSIDEFFNAWVNALRTK
jgi:serine/threonine-protein kinase